MANRGVRLSWDGFRDSRSCLTNMITFYGQVTFLVGDVDIYMDFSKTFVTVSHSILMGKLAAQSLVKCSLHQVKNCILLSIFFHP